MRDNHSKDYDKNSKHEDPPNSRLFVAHTKHATEEELKEAFSKYGHLEDVWMCKDRNTGEQKDIAFIKFSKTSDAARAMEGLNGKILEGHNRPLKVTVALSRDQPNSGNKGDDMERLLRLFVVVPKSMTEEEITEEFEKFGEIDYVSVVKDRETKESKGYAFVKFTKVSHAATAFEECDRSFKAVFARPKEQDQRKGPPKDYGHQDMYEGRYNSNQSNSYSSMQPPPSPFLDGPSYNQRQNYTPSSPMDMIHSMMGGRSDTTRLTALVSTQLSEEQVERLFDIIPGLQTCQFYIESSSAYNRTPLLRRVMIEYSNPSSAAYALEKMHGFEYPPGKKIVVKSEFDQRGEGNSMMGSVAGKRDAMALSAAAAPEITQELATLTKALAEATNMIKLQVGGALGGRMGNSMGSDTYNPSLCSVRLPPPQPLARKEAKMAERLFIMGLPSLPPQTALWDVFGRFGELIEVFIINGKNCGFVNYARKESAERALEALHGEEVYGMRLKVTFADPPKSDSRKRLKMDTDN